MHESGECPWQVNLKRKRNRRHNGDWLRKARLVPLAAASYRHLFLHTHSARVCLSCSTQDIQNLSFANTVSAPSRRDFFFFLRPKIHPKIHPLRLSVLKTVLLSWKVGNNKASGCVRRISRESAHVHGPVLGNANTSSTTEAYMTSSNTLHLHQYRRNDINFCIIHDDTHT